MPPSSARAAICAARMSSVLTSPPSSSSFSSSADSTAFSLAAASPVCELWASSAITAKRLPCVAASLRTASRANGKVWMVQTTIFLSPESASASSPLLLPSFALDRGDHAGRPLEIEERFLQAASRSRCGRRRPARCRTSSCAARRAGRPGSGRTRRSSWSCRSPPNAGSGICRPALRSSTAAWSFRVASSWW